VAVLGLWDFNSNGIWRGATGKGSIISCVECIAVFWGMEALAVGETKKEVMAVFIEVDHSWAVNSRVSTSLQDWISDN
jgi:hypothetical protein